MTKKKEPNLNMRKELRITGDRDAPNLPILKREDFAPGLWDAVHEPSWTIKEASHYMHEVMPGQAQNSAIAKEVERTRFWLVKEYEKSTDNVINDDFKRTPGDIMRFLWESRRPVSLKVWALYYLLDKGHIDFRIEAHILQGRYVRAAEVIWEKFPLASVEEVASFFVFLPHEAKDDNGLPLFASRSFHTLEGYIKSQAKRKPGRPPSESKIILKEHKAQLIDLIKKELGN